MLAYLHLAPPSLVSAFSSLTTFLRDGLLGLGPADWAKGVVTTEPTGAPRSLAVEVTARRLGVSDEFISEVDQAVTQRLGVGEAHRFLVAGFAEEAGSSPDCDWKDHEPELVDQVVLHQRAHELAAAVDDDIVVEFPFQL